jgi:hypothetical protein
MFTLALRAAGAAVRSSAGVSARTGALAQLVAPRVAPGAAVVAAGAGAPSAAAAAAAALPAPARGVATMTRRRRKELRKGGALARRQLLEFAAGFDPARTARGQVGQTLKYLGWAYNAAERVPGGVTLDFSLREWYCAFAIVDGANYVLPGSAEASDDCGFGPGVPPPVNAPPAGGGRLTRLTHPSSTPFPAAPPTWLNPVRGLVLDKATAARHASIREKGWKLAAIPQPLWEVAAARRHQHYARRDLLMSLAVPLAPFEARPVELQAQQAVVSKKAAKRTRAAASAATAAEGAVAAEARADTGTRRRAAAKAAVDLAAAQEDSHSGRSRKARVNARAKVTAAGEAATAE